MLTIMKDSKTLRQELDELDSLRNAKHEELRDAVLSERGVSIGCTIQTRKGEKFVVKKAYLSYRSIELHCVPFRKDGSEGTAHRVIGEYDGWKVVVS